jgi:predicted transposase YdaD
MVYKFTNLSREEIEAMLGLNNLKQTRVYQEARQEERREVVENLLKAKFGEVDVELSQIIEPLLQLTPAEFTPLLLQLSREQLLERFQQNQ